MKQTQEALGQLLPVGGRFPTVWTMPYNPACYCAQLGPLEECRAWLQKAMALDERTVTRAVVEDPDLKPLWDSLGGTPGKQAE